MSVRNTGRGSQRRSPRLLERSQTPEVRNLIRALTPTYSARSSDLIEQLTPSAAASRFQRPLIGANASSHISVKQEDTSTSYYVREPSNQPRLTSPPSYQPALLRGDQRSFNDPREANASLSASMSIFSSEGDPADNYQQEESEVARMQNEQQQRPTSRTTVTRRVPGQRKPRTSADDLAYRPASDEDVDDDDDGGSPTRRTRRGRNSNSFGAIEQGRIDNIRWRNTTAKMKKKARRKTVNGVPVDADEDDSRELNGEEDAGAASGKETRFDGASDAENDQDDNDDGAWNSLDTDGIDKPPAPAKQHAAGPLFGRLFIGVTSYIGRLLAVVLTLLLKLPRFFWRKYWSFGSGARLILAALLFAAAAHLFAPSLGILDRLSSHVGLLSNDGVSGSSGGRSLALSLDRENQRLRGEINRLSSRLDMLSSSIDAQISASLSSAAAKIQADADTRQSTEIKRLSASTKRTVSRLAQDELKSIQDSVSASVELMLRDLDQKINSQLKQRADDTEGKFLHKLEGEVARIAKYANEQVNARLGQAFDQTFVSTLVDEKLERYSRDRTDEMDWASVTSGAWISEQGTVHRGYRINSVWNLGQFLAQGRKVAIGDPVKAITPGAGLGVDNCWMTGWNSFLQVQLVETKVVEGLAVEHALPGMVRTAPRRILVWGIVDESDQHIYLQYRRSQAQSQDEYLKSLLPPAYLDAIPHEYTAEGSAPLLLSFAEFQPTASTLQHLNLTKEAQVYPFGVKAVRWQFVDGWNKAPPICVHRVRVHAADWPVFAPHQS